MYNPADYLVARHIVKQLAHDQLYGEEPAEAIQPRRLHTVIVEKVRQWRHRPTAQSTPEAPRPAAKPVTTRLA
jgi:hypothetical protein